MKGVSTVIATILMLMITIALAGTAYLYISGTFATQTQGLELVDSFCSAGTTAVITLRNAGTNNIGFSDTFCNPDGGDGGDEPDPVANGNAIKCGAVTIVRTSGNTGNTMMLQGNTLTIAPGTTGELKDTDHTGVSGREGCTVSGEPRTCVYRITPPGGRSVVATVSCPG